MPKPPRSWLGSGITKSAASAPEAAFIVTVDDDRVTCRRPDGNTEQVRWSQLRAVSIYSNDRGPWSPDMFWVLEGPDATGCVVPWGATGGDELLKRLQALPGFDNEAVIHAAPQETGEFRRTCWEK